MGKPYVDRKKKCKYKITKCDLCYRLFMKHGFKGAATGIPSRTISILRSRERV
jgi:hypothetical protein